MDTADEHRRSHNELTKFLSRGETAEGLSDKCILAIVELQNQLKSCESKLAAYNRMYMKCSMDACTTSPAEC